MKQKDLYRNIRKLIYGEANVNGVPWEKTPRPLYQYECSLPKDWEKKVVSIGFKESTQEYNIIEFKVRK